jgi:hypothetical protein
LVVMCLHCSYGRFDTQAVTQQANVCNQPSLEAVGWIAELGLLTNQSFI